MHWLLSARTGEFDETARVERARGAVKITSWAARHTFNCVTF